MNDDMTNEGPETAGSFMGEDVSSANPADAHSFDDQAITPEIYGDFGFEDGQFDPETMNSFKGILAEAGLPKDAGIAIGSRLAALQQDHLSRAQAEMSGRWLAETRADREFGGVRLPQTQTRIAAAIDAFGGPDAAEIRSLFNETGLGNHPALVRFFARAGKAISEDGMINSGAAASRGDSAATLLFPSMKGK